MKMLYRFIVAAALLLPAVAPAAPHPAQPKLVVGIVVDQMRWDYLFTLSDLWGAGGFARLLGEGYSCNNTIIDYVPTVTACGHATIYTGSTPTYHGIAGNDYMIDGHMVSSVQDDNTHGVGTTWKGASCSPRNLLANTLGDQLKLASDGRSRVVGVALKDRAAILPAGHAADGAYWYDGTTHQFITSDYYCQQLPRWVEAFNRDHSALLASDLQTSPSGVTATLAMAEAALVGEELGTDNVTDLLAVSISTTDITAHKYGVRAQRTDSIYEQLDRDLAHFLDVLDARVGRGNYLLFVSADHGGTYSESHAREIGVITGQWYSNECRKQANSVLCERFGVEKLIKTDTGFSFYLDNEAIARAGLDRDAVKSVAVDAIQGQSDVMLAIDCERAAMAPIPSELRERIMLGWNRKRSGELFVMPINGYYSSWQGNTGSNHGSWTQSDSHIPLLFFGWNVPHGETSELTHMTDITATICAMLHVQAPNACIGIPIDLHRSRHPMPHNMSEQPR